MEPAQRPRLRRLEPGIAVLPDSVRLLQAGVDADLFVGRSSVGQALFFIEDSRYRWLIGENADVTRTGFERWGLTRDQLLACVTAALYGHDPIGVVGRIADMLPDPRSRPTDSTPTAPVRGPSRSPG